MKKLLVVLLLISTFSMNLFAEPVVGHKAPSIEFSASLDMRISQRDFLGKVLILDFWATSCVPCIASFPKLNSLIMFLSITSENKELVEDFIRKRNIVLDAIKLIDSDNATTNNFEINGLPETFVIDKSGVIRWIGRIDDLNVKMLKSLSEENISNALFADFNNINQNRSGMSFYINNVSNGYNSYTSFYDYKLKYWKFNTDGSNIIDIIKGIAMPRLEADIQFLNPEAAKDKNYVLRFRLDIQLMNVRQKQYFQDRVHVFL